MEELTILNETVYEIDHVLPADAVSLAKLKYKHNNIANTVGPKFYEDGDEVMYFSSDQKTNINCSVLHPEETVMEYTYEDGDGIRVEDETERINFGGELGTVYFRCNYQLKEAWGNQEHGCTGFSQGTKDVPCVVGGMLSAVMPKNGNNGTKFFSNMTCLVDASNLVLPVEDKSGRNVIFDGIFEECVNLKHPPQVEYLRATDIEFAFRRMFYNCVNLESTLDCTINVDTTCKSVCYEMYANCAKIKYGHKMYILNYGDYCFYHMYYNCTNLLSSGEYNWHTGDGRNAYEGAYEGCTSLEKVPETIDAGVGKSPYCYYRMFYGCTSLKHGITPPWLGSHSAESMYEQCVNIEKVNIIGETVKEGSLLKTFYGDYNITYCMTGDWQFDSYDPNNDENKVTGGVLIYKKDDSPVCLIKEKFRDLVSTKYWFAYIDEHYMDKYTMY